MAAKRSTLGVNHPTVVPTNFEPERSHERDDESDADERDEDA